MASHDAPDLRLQPGPHAFVADLDQAILSDDDHHHLQRSLRLRDGDELTASDGDGRWRSFRFGSPLEAVGPIVQASPYPYALALAVALTKGSKPELAVQKATELGIDRIVIFSSDHSVVRWDDDKVERGLTRLRRVAREAAMQSRQVRVPTVSFLPGVAALAHEGFSRADFAGSDLDATVRSLAIGAEGGWSERERLALPSQVDLGGSVLRAETAAIAASARMAALRSSK